MASDWARAARPTSRVTTDQRFDATSCTAG